MEEGQTPKTVASPLGVYAKTVRKWVERYRTEGSEDLHDRSSRPHRLRAPTPKRICQQVVALRRARRTGAQIAAETAVSPAIVSRILKRHGLNRLRDMASAGARGSAIGAGA